MPSYDQIANILTKSLSLDPFWFLKAKISVTKVPLSLREGVKEISKVMLENDKDNDRP